MEFPERAQLCGKFHPTIGQSALLLEYTSDIAKLQTCRRRQCLKRFGARSGKGHTEPSLLKAGPRLGVRKNIDFRQVHTRPVPHRTKQRRNPGPATQPTQPLGRLYADVMGWIFEQPFERLNHLCPFKPLERPCPKGQKTRPNTTQIAILFASNNLHHSPGGDHGLG